MGLTIAALGLGCLLRPAAVQDLAVRMNKRSRFRNPFIGWIQRPSFRAYLRLMGLGVIIFGALVIMGATRILQRCC